MEISQKMEHGVLRTRKGITFHRTSVVVLLTHHIHVSFVNSQKTLTYVLQAILYKCETSQSSAEALELLRAAIVKLWSQNRDDSK